MATQPARIFDRFRRPLFPGVQVELHSQLPVVFTVLDIRPIVDPRQPAGLYQVDLTVQLPIVAMNGGTIDAVTAVVYPKAVDADRKPEPELATQTNDGAAGSDQYTPPEAQMAWPFAEKPA